MTQRLVIFGAGGFGREVLQLVRDINAVSPVWTCDGFLVDSQYAACGGLVQGLPILGDLTWLNQNELELIARFADARLVKSLNGRNGTP